MFMAVIISQCWYFGSMKRVIFGMIAPLSISGPPMGTRVICSIPPTRTTSAKSWAISMNPM